MNPSRCIRKPVQMVTWAAVSLLLVCCASVQAQKNENPKYEFGLHIATLNVSEKSDTDSGLGFRFTYNFNDYLGVEAEEAYFGNMREGSEGNERQGLFGVRAGKRNSRYGVFAKVRPGYTRFYSLGTPTTTFFDHDRTRFALDVGGVFEYYPVRNLAVRVDVGDTMVHFKSGDFFQRDFDKVFVQRRLSHNLQVNVGVALRF